MGVPVGVRELDVLQSMSVLKFTWSCWYPLPGVFQAVHQDLQKHTANSQKCLKSPQTAASVEKTAS